MFGFGAQRSGPGDSYKPGAGCSIEWATNPTGKWADMRIQSLSMVRGLLHSRETATSAGSRRFCGDHRGWCHQGNHVRVPVPQSPPFPSNHQSKRLTPLPHRVLPTQPFISTSLPPLPRLRTTGRLSSPLLTKIETAPLQLRPLSRTVIKSLGVLARSPGTTALYRDLLFPQAIILYLPAPLPRSLTAVVSVTAVFFSHDDLHPGSDPNRR